MDKKQIVTCKRCHANVPQEQTSRTIYRGVEHTICHACIAEMEKAAKAVVK